MNKWIVLILFMGMACVVSLGTAATCPSCCCDEKGCLCPFYGEEFCEDCFNPDPCPPCLCPFGNESCYENWNIFGNFADLQDDIVFPDKTGTIKASFTADKTSGSVPLTVQFTDTSTGSPNIWGWDFGDGTNSALQNPVHTYTFPGNYSVTFMAKKYVKEGTRESIMTAQIMKPDYIMAGGEATVSGSSGESATPVVSSPPATVATTPGIIQPVIQTPVYPMYGGYVVIPLISGTSGLGSPVTVASPVTPTAITAGQGTFYQPVPLSGSFSPVTPLSVPMNFLLGYHFR